ncbi:MAG: glycoside hydrolase [Acidobacteriota bacterium]|nr:glycoside hydrolase [Acidobacteriota bacterium]
MGKLTNRSDLLLRLLVSLALLYSSAIAQQSTRQRSPVPAVNQTITASNIAELERLFQNPPDDSRIMMRWWWFGPAVTKPELEREMRLMKEGGIGGFEVQAVYPVVLDDAANGIRTLPFLSDEFIEALRFTAEKARELGLRMDLTLGSGWPFGGPQVRVDQAAGALRFERVKVEGNTRRVAVPQTSAGEKFIAAFLARSQGQSIVSVRELTEIRDGAVWLPVNLEGPHEVLFFTSGRAGMQVKRPAVGGEGFVLNHMDRAATDHYLKTVGDRLMQAFGSDPPHAIFCDSLEVYNQDWTSDFLEEFQKRRGYDLKPHLPALIADVGTKTAAIRHDWGQTQTELLNERFLAPMQAWSKQNRTLFRIQNYGIPAATISSNAFADLPEGEGPQWKVVRASRWASSASHIYGRPVTSSETWTWLHSPSFRATPLDVKAEADLHFLQGINQLIGHGWPYTPQGIEYPGWRFYAAGVYNEKNPWWHVMPDVARYLQRVSFLMRQGQPANDVALYLPNSDGWASFTAGKVHLIETLREHLGTDIMPAIFEAGYNLDFFDDDALRQVGRVEKNALALGSNKYKVVILPGVERIPLDTLKVLDEFARGGGIVIATRRKPEVAPGFMSTEAEQRQIQELARGLFEGTSAPAHFVADEKTQLGGKLTSLLRPDVALSPSVAEIGHIHRRTADSEIYYIANTSSVRRNVEATFRVEGMQPELWDPMTGHMSPMSAQAGQRGGSTIPLDLEPYGSRVLVFSKRASTARFATQPLAKGTTNAPVAPIDLTTNWRVTFGESGKTVQMDKLRSWTEDEETRYFSGLATYEKEINVPENLLQNGHAMRLDFGEGQSIPSQNLRSGMQAWLDAPVRDAAVIYINDRRAGSVWLPPYMLDVTGLLRSGANRIKIVVGNTAINHMAGRRLPDYRLLNLRYGERFTPQDMDKVQPVPSGLLGPIRLVAIRNRMGLPNVQIK